MCVRARSQYAQGLWVARMDKAIARGKEDEKSPWVKDQVRQRACAFALKCTPAWRAPH